MATHDNAFTTRMAKIMVAGAVFAAAIYAIDLGFARAAHWYLAPAIVVGLLCVVIGEILAWHNAAMAYHERRAGSVLLWAALAMVCSAGTLYTNYSTSASNQDEKSAVQLTAFTQAANVGDSLKDAKKELSRIQGRIDGITGWKVDGKPYTVRTIESAQADIENAMAHKFWKYTDGCKVTKGKDSRAFCDKVANYRAEKDMAAELKTLEAELPAAKAAVDEARTASSEMKAVVSDDTPGITLIDNMIGDKAMARQLDSMTFPLLVQAIMFFGGILLANETARNMVRKPWIDWKRVGYRVHWVLAALSFKELPPLPESKVVHNHTTVTKTDAPFARAINARMNQIGAGATA